MLKAITGSKQDFLPLLVWELEPSRLSQPGQLQELMFFPHLLPRVNLHSEISLNIVKLS